MIYNKRLIKHDQTFWRFIYRLFKKISMNRFSMYLLFLMHTPSNFYICKPRKFRSMNRSKLITFALLIIAKLFFIIMTHSVRLMFISNETETDVFPTQHSSHKKCKNYCSFIIKKLKQEKTFNWNKHISLFI